MGVASALQKVGVIGDEVTLAGMQQLATFQLSEKEIGTLSGGMTDLLAQQKGLNATQSDAVNISNMIGKAMQGQVGALSRVGISFTEAQEKAMKTGDATQRAAVIAEVLAQNVGGVNKALAETDQGKIQQAANAYGDMREEIGKKLLPIQAKFSAAFSKNLPAIQKKITGIIDRIAPKVDGFIENIKTNMPKIKKALDVAKTAFHLFTDAMKFAIDNANWLIPVLASVVTGFIAFNVISAVVSLFKAFVMVTEGATAAQGLFNFTVSLNPIGLTVIAVATLAGAIALLVLNWGDVTAAIKGAWEWLTKWNGENDKSKPGEVSAEYERVLPKSALSLGGKALGTPYVQGGLTRVNEGGRGEIMNLPNGWDYIDFFKRVREQAIPIRLVLTGKDESETLNMPATIDSLSYETDRVGDIHASLSLGEYRLLR